MGSIDLAPSEDADGNVVVVPSESWVKQEQEVAQKVEELLGGEKVDAILCVAGGWAGGNSASKGMDILFARILYQLGMWEIVRNLI